MVLELVQMVLEAVEMVQVIEHPLPVLPQPLAAPIPQSQAQTAMPAEPDLQRTVADQG